MATEEPRSGDDRLLALIDDWTHLDAEQIAESFNEQGDQLLDNFMERHQQDIPDGQEQRLREMLKQLERHGRAFEEEGAEHTDAPKRLRHLLQTQVVPLVKGVLRASNRAKEAHGQRDVIPGRAYEARADRAAEARQHVDRSINNQVALMGEYRLLQELEDQNTYGTLSTQDELSMYSAQKDVIARSLYLWGEANKRARGAYAATLSRLQNDLRKTEVAIADTHARLFGEGSAAAQAQVDEQNRQRRSGASGERPWATAYQEDVMGPTRARYASRPWDPSNPKTPLPRPWKKKDARGIEDMFPSVPTDDEGIPTMLRLRGGAKSKSRSGSGSRSGSASTVDATGGPSRSQSVSLASTQGFASRGHTASTQRFASPTVPASGSASPQLHPDMVPQLGDLRDEPIVLDSDDEPIERERAALAHVQILAPGGDFLGYNLPFAAPNPEVYQQAYGARAKDVVDLFRTNHRALDYRGTAELLFQLMTQNDDGIDLDEPLPQLLLDIQGNRHWGTSKLRDILGARIKHQPIRNGIGAALDMTQLSHEQAYELIKKGKPNQPKVKRKNAPRGSKDLAPLRRQAESVRPAGLLVELFNRWRLSAAAGRAGFTDTDPLQLFSYHRRRGAQGVGMSPSVPRAPEPMRVAMKTAGYSRQQLKTIGSLFGPSRSSGENPFNPEFWAKSQAEQLAWMKGRTGPHNPNNWINVLEEGFGITLASLGVKREGVGGSYSDADRTRIWVAVSGKMREFMNQMGAARSFSEAGDYIATYAAGLTPSPMGQYPDRLGVSRRSRTRSAESEIGDLKEEETDEEDVVAPRVRAGKRKKKRLTMADAHVTDIFGLPPMSKPGSYKKSSSAGTHLYGEWQNMVGTFRSTTVTGGDLEHTSGVLEGNLLQQLKEARGRRKNAAYRDVGSKRRVLSSFHLWTNLRGGRTNEDQYSFKILLDKIGWNEYIRGLGPWLPAKARRDALFEDVPSSNVVFTQIFRPGDHERVADMLQKWVSARIFNKNADRGPGAPVEANMKKLWHAQTQKLAFAYQQLESAYAQEKKPFPVEDWRTRLYEGNQWFQLDRIYENITRGKELLHDDYVAPAPGIEDDEKEPTPSPRKRRSRGGARIPRAAGTSGGIPPPQRVGHLKPERGAALQGAGGRAELPAGILEAIRQPTPGGPGRPPVAAQVLDDVLPAEVLQYVGQAPAGFVQLPGRRDALMEDAAAEEAAILAVPLVRLPIRTHDNRLRAEVVQQQNYEALNGVHLMQTDNNVQPVMGAVHIVHPDRNYSDKHFMLDVEGDINEGQKVLVERSKRGPFKTNRGRSTVMDRSAHITYRKRAGVFEITVRRGVISAELKQLLSKLSMHRMSIHGSRAVLIKGSKRFRLGPLNELDLKYLMQLVDECLQQYGTCGLELTESRAGSGALYKAGVHGARFKSDARKGRGVAR